MNDTTKFAIGAGLGLLLWSKLRGIILFGWLLFLVFIVWAVVTGEPEKAPNELSSQKLDWESEKRIKDNKILAWAKTVDLDSVALASIKVVSQPQSPYYVPDWKQKVLEDETLVECHEAVKNNSPEGASRWCGRFYNSAHENPSD